MEYLSICVCPLKFLPSVFYRSFTSLVKFLDVCVCVCVVDTVNGIALIFQTVHYWYIFMLMMFVYCVSCDFTKFISLNTFLVVSLSFSKYKIVSSVNKTNLTSCFPIWMPFISLA